MGATALSARRLRPADVARLGVRVAGPFASRVSNVVVTNVPGRRVRCTRGRPAARHVPGGARSAGGQALTIGVTSYDGGMHYGLTADRDALPDVDVLAGALVDALAELVAAAAR